MNETLSEATVIGDVRGVPTSVSMKFVEAHSDATDNNPDFHQIRLKAVIAGSVDPMHIVVFVSPKEIPADPILAMKVVIECAQNCMQAMFTDIRIEFGSPEAKA